MISASRLHSSDFFVRGWGRARLFLLMMGHHLYVCTHGRLCVGLLPVISRRWCWHLRGALHLIACVFISNPLFLTSVTVSTTSPCVDAGYVEEIAGDSRLDCVKRLSNSQAKIYGRIHCVMRSDCYDHIKPQNSSYAYNSLCLIKLS